MMPGSCGGLPFLTLPCGRSLPPAVWPRLGPRTSLQSPLHVATRSGWLSLTHSPGANFGGCRCGWLHHAACLLPPSAAVVLFGTLLPHLFLPSFILFFSQTFLCASLHPAILPSSRPPLLHPGPCSLALERHWVGGGHGPCSEGVRVQPRSHACDEVTSA